MIIEDNKPKEVAHYADPQDGEKQPFAGRLDQRLGPGRLGITQVASFTGCAAIAIRFVKELTGDLVTTEVAFCVHRRSSDHHAHLCVKRIQSLNSTSK